MGGGRGVWFFFIRQKTAYELLRSLVGSEMCIRDGRGAAAHGDPAVVHPGSSGALPDLLGNCGAHGLAVGQLPDVERHPTGMPRIRHLVRACL